jgi:hypothetical protein
VVRAAARRAMHACRGSIATSPHTTPAAHRWRPPLRAPRPALHRGRREGVPHEGYIEIPFHTELMYSDSLRGSGEACKGVKKKTLTLLHAEP